MSDEKTVLNTSADPTLEFTELKLGSKTYKLIYDFDSIAIAEEMTRMPLLIGVNWANIGVRRIRAMLYASALKAQPDVTLKEFTPHIVPANMGRIEAALAEAWMKSKEDETAKDNEAKKEDAAENPPVPEPEPANESSS